jgi:uncharacterized protein YcfJ
MKRAAVVSLLSIAVLSAGVGGCESKAGTGALIGGAAGAGLGAIIGNQSHGRGGGGALIGGAVGAGVGALVGNEMDKKDREEARASRPVEREVVVRRTTVYESRTIAVTKEDVIEWTRRGDRDELIIDRVERSPGVFRLSSRDENYLRDNGVSEGVIRAMKDTGRR